MNRIILLLIACLSTQTLVAQNRPNVVVILSDDYGWGSVGCYGANPDLVRTPNLDRLAKEGRRFTDANTTSSVCSPTRYSVLTGRYCWRTSLQSEVLSTTAPLHIETTRLTLASMLKSQGYMGAAIGKWHLGYGTAEKCDYSKELKPGPLEIGFDYHFSVPSNHGDVAGVFVEDHWVFGLNKDSPTNPSPPYVPQKEGKRPQTKNLPLNAPKRVDEDVMDVLTGKAVSWIERQSAEKPFLLYFTPVAVHNPITPSKATAGHSKGGPFCDFIEELDTSVGRVLEALERKGFSKNTIVLFSSDNGGVNVQRDCPQATAQNAGLKPVGPFRGGKHNVWEGGFRVPYIVKWPGHVPANTVCDETVSLVDTLASVAAVTGYALPKASEAAEDSIDVSKAWLGDEYAKPLRMDLISHSADGNFAIRRGPWKWIEGVPADDVKPAALKAHADEFKRQLYNLQSDIAETNEVSAANEEVVKDLEATLIRYRDGGYSREMPPVMPKLKPVDSALAPLAGERLLDLPFAEMPPAPWAAYAGRWQPRDGAIWAMGEGKAPAALRGPLKIADGVLQYEIMLGKADRHSLRLQTGVAKNSFRVIVSRGKLEIAKNPSAGETEALVLAQLKVKLKTDVWQTLRLTFRGGEVTVEIAGNKLTAKHPILTEPRSEMNLLAFEGEIGFRNLVVTR